MNESGKEPSICSVAVPSERHRCIVNEGCEDEWVAAGNTRDEVDAILREAEADSCENVRTKRFFKVKGD